MDRFDLATRASIVRCLVDGSSIRATARITGTSKTTVFKLLVELGGFCSGYQAHVLTNLRGTRVEAVEIWAFVGVKQRSATATDTARLHALRPEEGQPSRLYLARPGFHAFVEYPGYLMPRLVQPQGLRLLQRYGAPTDVSPEKSGSSVPG